MTVHRLRALVSDDFDAVNALIIQSSQSPITLIDDLSNHIIQSGGKRLRPLLVLLASHACQYLGKQHLTLAAMVEFFHTATLLHDDVVDESTLRRGRTTANEIWGNKASILVGDYLFAQYMKLMIQVGDLGIMTILTDMAHQIGCGEIKQLTHRHNLELTLDEYLDIIQAKTSLLFAASCRISARLSHSTPAIEEALNAYGLHLGNAFQLKDDALDYCSDAKTIGKNIGDDLVDGKLTLPLLHALQHSSPMQQEKIKQSLMEGSLEHFPDVLQAIHDTQAIEYTLQQATIEMEQALSALSIIPDSVYKEALVDLARYAVLRDQ